MARKQYTPDLEAIVMEVLDRFFGWIEDGKAGDIHPAVSYAWTYYEDTPAKPMTIERLRAGLSGLDDYLNNTSQHGWAERDRHMTFDIGPDLLRLPDAAVWALFQELDGIFARHLVLPAREPATIEE